MPRANQNLFDGTRRPVWARDVDIKTHVVKASRSPSDRRYWELVDDDDMVVVPRSIAATILPVTTSGRRTPNVNARKLDRFFLDRGHLMAFSLGAPWSTDIMFAQNRHVNQKARNFAFEASKVSDLSWRAMEIYLKYIAYRGLMGAPLPNPRENVQIRVPEEVKIGDAEWDRIPEILSTEYEPTACFSARSYTLEYFAACNYHDFSRPDDVTSIDVEITVQSMIPGRRPITLLNSSFENRAPADVEDAIIDREERKIERRELAYGPQGRFAQIKRRHALDPASLAIQSVKKKMRLDSDDMDES